jgi:hypothetical protein
MAILVEGLKEGDLEDLVIPLISVDEYESKLDDDSIVVAFMVQDKDPAQDLNRFIQKGAVEILDTDVSPAPNEDGYFLVFVELLRDAEFPQKLLDTLASIEGLTGLSDDRWKAQLYDQTEELPVDLDTLTRLVRLVPKPDDQGPEPTEPAEDPVEENLTEFFRASDLDDMVIEGHQVTLEARGVEVELQLVDLGTMAEVYENNAIMASATRLDESANANCRRMSRMLGDLWIAEQRGSYMVLSHALRDQCGLFKL